MGRALIAVAVVTASLAASLAAGAATSAGTTKLEAALRGSNERPAAPAANRGRAELRLNTATGKVCWEFYLKRIDGKPIQAHIHVGGKSVSGNVVVPLGAKYKREGCTTAAKSLVRAIVKKPGAYYVNVHNAKHPAGAMRGQLVRG
jgi:CHRD domain